ncbi:MAG: universal stress protein [Leptolyngbyaceae cyanobacterium RU_5_1]|nr:universal stress protein [Leptolyngbyaceae cyanobacterium RU_5_1]
MLTRLENALGSSALTKQMVLLSKSRSPYSTSSSENISLVVGYNGSPCSQTALDLTLWIAHQTRLATRKSVTVQVVYVIDLTEVRATSQCQNRQFGFTLPFLDTAIDLDSRAGIHPLEELSEPVKQIACGSASGRTGAGWLVAELPEPTQSTYRSPNWQLQQFEQADQILWQARHLANEWRGSLKTHLRFGSIAEELCAVAEAESATVLLLGCRSADHPLVRSLESTISCPVLGIPYAS